MNKKIHINAGEGYDFIIGDKLFSSVGTLAAATLGADRVAVFTDSNIEPLYAQRIEEQLRQARFHTCRFVFPAGERSKNMDTISSFLNFMSENNLTRRDAVVVIGGGVAGDMGGFAASIYLRGIKFVQIPTTLLAAVDSSVGGKTGIDTPHGKNLVGTFWQPSLVLCDTQAFQSLSRDQILDGLAEVIKSAAIRAPRVFRDLEEKPFDDNMADIIARCVTMKGDVVEEDEKESGVRRILNFGHTMAHAIELRSDYSISHGKAVAIGMLMVTKASEHHGMTQPGTYDRLYRLIRSQGYRTETDIPLAELCEAAAHDKKTAGSSIHLVYLKKIGEAATELVPLADLHDFLNV